MADQNQALIARGLSQGQGPDINELAQLLQNQGAQRPPNAPAGRTPGTGVGVFDVFTRGRRAEEAQEIAAGQGQAALVSSGVRQAEVNADRLAGIRQQLSNPATRAAGIAELDQISVAQGINATPTTRKIQMEQLAQAQIKTNVDVLAAQQAAGIGMSPERLVSTSDMLFDDRQREMLPFRDRLASFDQLMSVVDSESGPATVAVLFKFIKSMDDSVVRTSEGELLVSSVGALGNLANEFNKLLGGGIFDENTRNQIKETATQLGRQTFATANRINTDHDERAARFAEQFQTPALRELSRGAGFDPGRTFNQGPATTVGGSPGEPAAAEITEPPPGFSVPD